MLLKRGEISFTFERTPSISLNCKIVPFQYREYEYGLLKLHSSCYIRTAVLYLTNIFHVAVRLFSNRLQITSKCGKKKKWHTRRYASVSLVLSPDFDILCDLLLKRRIFVRVLYQSRNVWFHILFFSFAEKAVKDRTLYHQRFALKFLFDFM